MTYLCSTELIVNAIEHLRQAENYIFSFIIASIPPLLTAVITYKFFHYQNRLKIEKENLDTANKWILLADEAMFNLITIKKIYCGKLTKNPIERATVIPSVLFAAKPIAEDYSQLVFLVPKQSSDKNQKWSSIRRIRIMIHNYNYVQELWLKRNEIDRPIKEKVVKQYSENAFASVTYEQIIECVGEANFCLLVDLTEKVVKLTDDLLVELNDFLINFPVYAETQINHKKFRTLGSVLTDLNNGNKV